MLFVFFRISQAFQQQTQNSKYPYLFFKIIFLFFYLHNNKQQQTTNKQQTTNNKRRELDGKFDASQQRSAQLEQSLLARAHALVSRRDALRGAPGGGFGGGGGRRGGRGMTFINLLFLAAFHNK